MDQWDVFYFDDCVAYAVEAKTADGAMDEYAQFAANESAHEYQCWRSRIAAGWLTAKPSRGAVSSDESRDQHAA